MLQMLPVLGRKLFCVNASGFIARDFLGLWSVVCGLWSEVCRRLPTADRLPYHKGQ
jgi:hypothetical protein